ncbi:MAG TPA: hypothetical protein VH370_06675 [Humisphaera sp.]|jgi:hypothetical protein|nr:hypothetical protein [Humisphaera sp.]
MAKNRKSERRRKEFDRLDTQFSEFHRSAPKVKSILRSRGINLAFHDFYDSYAAEFAKLVAEAKREHSSLIDAVLLEDTDYFSRRYSKFAPGMQQIHWRIDAGRQDYAEHATPGASARDPALIAGVTNAFYATDGRLKIFIGLRRSVPAAIHTEEKSVFRIVALLHEIGHMLDMEQQINFNHPNRTCNIIEAEIFAHLHALKIMAERSYHQCFELLVDALRRSASDPNCPDYLREVSRLTLDRMPKYEFVDISAVLKAHLSTVGR